MLKRLGLGLLKGLVLGGAIGAGLTFGLGWAVTAGLLGYLLAMGTGATVGVLAGRPPWRQEAWIEGILKAVGGIGLAALLYWLGDSFAAIETPMAIGEAAAGTPWTHLPVLYAPAIGLVYGALVELDNTPSDEAKGKKGTARARAVRVKEPASIEEAVILDEKPSARKRGR